MVNKYDVIIIGAGPAGCVCGYLLKKAGINCVIVDFATFPREKICGGGLTPKAYELLQELMPELRYDYNGVNHFRLMMDSKTICEVDITKEIRMVCRKDFDYALLKQYKSIGGDFVNDVFSHFDEQEDGCVRVTLRSGKQLVGDYIVGADGANSRVRKQLMGNRKTNTLWMEQYVAKGANEFIFEFSSNYKKGYFYSFPNIDHDIIGMGGHYSSPKEIRALLSQNTIRSEINIKTEENTRSKDNNTTKEISGSPLLGANISVDTVASENNKIILIGDAGGFANKLTYEGLYYAIATGRNACRAIINREDFAIANREIFRKKKKEVFITNFFYSHIGLWLVKLGAHSPKLIKKAFEMNY